MVAQSLAQKERNCILTNQQEDDKTISQYVTTPEKAYNIASDFSRVKE